MNDEAQAKALRKGAFFFFSAKSLPHSSNLDHSQEDQQSQCQK